MQKLPAHNYLAVLALLASSTVVMARDTNPTQKALDSRAKTLACSLNDPPALCEYSYLYGQLIADCGLKPATKHFLKIPTWKKKKVPLPTEICQHYLGKPCYLDSSIPTSNDSKVADESLQDIFATVVTQPSLDALTTALGQSAAPPALAQLPMPDFSMDKIVEMGRSFVLDRRDCNSTLAASIAAAALTVKAKYDANTASNATLTLVDGYFHSPLALLYYDPATRTEADWNLLAWRYDAGEVVAYYVTGIGIPAAELDLHSRYATDANGSASGGLGYGIATFTASGSIDSVQKEEVHVHQYLVPNQLTAVRELDYEKLPSVKSIAPELNGSLRVGSPLAFSSTSGMLEGTYIASGMPVRLCRGDLWKLDGDAQLAGASYIPPSTASPLGACAFAISVTPTAAVQGLASDKETWKLSLVRSGKPWDGVALAIPASPADVEAFRITATRAGEKFQLGGGGVANIRMVPALKGPPSGCSATLVATDSGNLAAGISIQVTAANGTLCQGVKVEVPLVNGAVVEVSLPNL